MDESFCSSNGVTGQTAQSPPASPAPVSRIKPKLESRPRPARLPLSYAQQRLWFINKLRGASCEYNMPFGLRLRGELDRSALERALNTIVERHESLRTRFEEIDGEPAQVVEEQLRISVPLEDLSGFDEPTQVDHVRAALKREGAEPFDLVRGPLLRVKLLRLSELEHICLQTMHHITSDGWSWGVFHRELVTIYDAYRQARHNPLNPLTVQYADFTLWQREFLASGALEESLRYWKRQLAEIPERLELPADRPRHRTQSLELGVVVSVVPVHQAAVLKQLSLEHQATVYMSLLACFGVLMECYSGQDDIVVGSPVASRGQAGLENLIGVFVNTLVMRMRIDRELSFSQLLDEVKATAWEAYQHQDVPFDQLVEELSPHRSPEQTPLIQVLVVLQSMPWGPQPLGMPLRMEPFVGDAAQARFDLEVHAWETDGRLDLRWLYNADLFDRWRIEQMARHFASLLETVLAHPERPLRLIDVLTHDEKEEILIESNGTKEDPPEGTLVDLIHQQVERNRDAVAVVFEEHRLTYSELDRRANRVAHYLRRQGVKAEDRVGVALARSLELVAAIVGILKAGGAYVPLDQSHPAERLSLMLADASVRVLLSDEPSASALSGPDSTLLIIDPSCDAVAEESSERPPQIAGSENIAYAIYTSGSTGRPKGVAIEHRNATAFLLWAEKVFGPEDRAEVLASTSVCFDLSVFELFLPLCKGGRIVLAQDALDIGQVSRTNHPTLVNTVPSAMAALLGMNAIPASVRVVNLAGEPLTNDLVSSIYERTNAKVLDLYGPSETTTYSTWAIREPGGPHTIGRPIVNERAYVLDASLRPVPLGVVGELFIGGLGVSRCYLDRPRITADRFIPDPWGETGSRMYSTGDLAHWMVGGQLEFVGRADYQVKLRGFRIELGEIEATMRSHQRVRDAVVIVRDSDEDKCLIAYATRSESGAERSAARISQIRQWQQLYDSIYEQGDERSEDSDLAGWISSYTGEPIPPGEMWLWVDQTVARLKELNAERVVEIGCGTGLLLKRLAPECASYTGIEFSAVALSRLSAYLSGRDELSCVELKQGLAHELGFLGDASVDLVILNSVVQYFPDVQYLIDVLQEAMRVTKRGGHIFVGDVRSLPLLEAYHTSIELYKAGPESTLGQIRRRVGQAMRDEEELAVDGRFFEELARWPWIARVKTLPKGGGYYNELNRFRYDVLISVGGDQELLEPARWVTWDQDGHWKTEVKHALLQGPSGSVGLRDFSNRRVAAAAKAVRLLSGSASDAPVAELHDALGEATGNDPDEVNALAGTLGVEVVWRRVGTDAVHDVVFNPTWRSIGTLETAPYNGGVGAPQHREEAIARLARFTNTPSKNAGNPDLVHELKLYLAQKLPDYMVPTVIVILPSLPLTPHGKLDRRKLPLPDLSVSGEGYRPPMTPEEEICCEIFAQVLGADRIGVDDDFFAMGGHSLMATRLASRIRASFGADIAVRTVFEAPTPGELVSRIRETRVRRPPLRPQIKPPRLPLSYAQQRLWFVEQLDGPSCQYNLPVGFKLSGHLDIAALEFALNMILERHESLRTHFEGSEDSPAQVVEQEMRIAVPVEDLSALDSHTQAIRVTEALRREGAEPFDLSRGPLIRVRLLKLGDSEHMLLRTAHHIVWDGWSEAIFNRELGALYAAHKQAQDNPLKPLTVQYSDFTVWQRDWLESAALDEGLAYWKERLAGMPERLELPADRSDYGTEKFKAESFQTVLAARQVMALRKLSRGAQATLYMTLLTAFAALLSRYSGRDDIVVGSPIANREDAEAEKLIGFFVNMLLIRMQVGGASSFRALLAQVRNTTLEAYQHQEIPFERLVQELSPVRAGTGVPVLHIVFGMQNAPSIPAELAGLQVHRLETRPLRLPVDLAVHAVAEEDSVLRLHWIYNGELFDKWRIEQMARHYGRILGAMAEDLDQLVGSLQLMASEEMERILTDWNDVSCEAASDNLLDLFARQVRARPDAVAAICGAEHIRYEALSERTSGLASLLRTRGIGPEDVVALAIPRSLDFVTALLATMRVGAAYLPLDPASPQQRLSLILEDSKPACALTAGSCRLPYGGPQIAVDGPPTLETVDLGSGISIEGTESTPTYNLDSAVYVIYTSGSTGKPKGVVVSRRALVNKVSSWIKFLQISSETRYAVLISTSFDPISEEILTPLCVGGLAVMIPEESRRDLEMFTEYFDRHEPTVLPMSPALTEYWSSHTRTRPELLVIGGDVLDATLANRLVGNRSACRILNVYGPTETCIDASWYEVNHEELGSVPIGRPASNYKLYVLDINLQPAPLGVAGEMFVAGAGEARGYLNQPALTAERFVPNPYANGGRLFRTGDLSRWRPDGQIEFIGRIDDQVKIRGYRIEPGEVDAVLREIPGVRDAAVVVRAGDAGEKLLVAYVVWQDGRKRDAAEIRSCLKQRLPDYMIPAEIVALDRLPLMANGKVDRKALPAVGSYQGLAYVAPRTTTEELVAAVWAELLQVARVGALDDFFELGGHSLLGTRMIARLREMLNIEVPLREVFSNRTVAELSARSDELVRAGEGLIAPLIGRLHHGHRALSFVQERLWFLEELGLAGPAYNLPAAFRLKGKVDTEALRVSIEELVKRHETLRTRFETICGEGRQVIDPPESYDLEVEDLEQVDEAEREAEGTRLVQQEIETGFDLERGPVFRVKLVRMGEEDHLLLMTIHHIVADGWSMGVMMRELGSLYGAMVGGGEAGLPDLAIQYGDYAEWQREWLTGKELERQLAYWREKLTGAPILELPTDRLRPGTPSFRGAGIELEISAGLREGLERIAREERATLFMVLMAGFQAVLGRWSGQEDVVVGTPIAGRRLRETEGLIGCFVNMLAMRTDLSGRPTFRELVSRVKEVSLGAYAHQDIPFEKIVAELQPERDLSRQPVFQIVFAHQNLPQHELWLKGLEVLPTCGVHVTSAFDLQVFVRTEPKGMRVYVEYATDLFARESVERLMDLWTRLLEAVVIDADAQVEQIDLLGPQERLQILEDWNDSHREYPSDVYVHQLIEQQVARTPDGAALISGANVLSYAELDRRANRLSRSLQSRGVKPESLVGIAVERSFEMMVGVLGTLKAGAAYVPLDVDYPPQRLAHMVDDSGLEVIITLNKHREKLAAGKELVCLDTLRGGACPEDHEIPPATITGDNLAYVIYTSGSTGIPKGAMNTHRGIVNRLLWMQEEFQLTSEDLVLQKTPMSFDVSVWEMIWPLMEGAAVVLLDPGRQGDSRHIVSEILRTGVTTLHFIPGMLAVVLDEPHLDSCKSLKNVICSGESLKEDIVERLHERLSSVHLSNLYGPTEAAVDVTFWRARTGERVIIGKPIANTRIYLSDKNGGLAPPGVMGQIDIAGAGLSRGYVHRADLTAERFVPDAFNPQPGARSYRTGDLGRFLRDGNIQFAGRADHQVKIRGYRIELSEIEAVLSSFPGLQDVVVAANTSGAGDRRLLAYFVPSAGARISESELKRYLRDRLPEYMVPSAIVALERFPLAPGGKVDRKALPAPEYESRGRRAPRDAVELRLVRIWEESLGIRPIGVTANFFDLGGNSMLAVRLMALIQRDFKRTLPLSTLFAGPTVQELACILKQWGAGVSESPLVEIRPGGSGPPFFCVHPVGGNVFCYYELANSFNPALPFYALQASGIENGHRPLRSVEEMAASYIEAIRARQSHGPYLLGGWSAGGVVAYEMARQLRSRGEKIALVALIDSWAPSPSGRRDFDEAELTTAFLLDFLRISGIDVSISKEQFASQLRLLKEEQQSEYMLNELREREVLPAGTDLRQLQRLVDTFKANHLAVAGYRPRDYDGRVVLFCAEFEQYGCADPSRGWGRLSRRFEMQSVPGDHYSILARPQIAALAATIQRYIDESARP
jgi:pristinamycin I synthase-3/4